MSAMKAHLEDLIAAGTAPAEWTEEIAPFTPGEPATEQGRVMEKIIVNIRVELNASAPVTWGQLRRVVAGATPASDRLPIKPDQGPYPIKAAVYGIEGECTIEAE